MTVGDPLSLARFRGEGARGIALIDASSGETLRFAELLDRAHRLAAVLAAERGGGDRLLVFAATTRLPTFLALHAAILAGLPFLPLHPKLTAAERGSLLAFLGERASRVLDDDALDELCARAARLPAPAAPVPPSDPARPLALLHTSGTTGTPKLAVLSRRAFAASATATAHALRVVADDRWLLALPLCHVGGLSILTRSLVCGTPIVLLPRFAGPAAAETIARHRPTLFPLVPTMLRDLLPALSADAPLPRALIVGGAGCPEPLLAACADRGLLALTTYGLTETCSQLTLQPLRAPHERRAGSGVVLPSSSLSIVDATGRTLGAGETGEIVAAGPTLFDGYLDAPASASAAVPATGRGPFFTGDFGHLDAEGTLFVEGRRSDRIVTGGENVSPAEVEAVARRVRGVEDAVVFGVPDERWGEAVALCVVADERVFDEAVLALALRAELSSFKRPRAFARIANVPLTSMGKIDRRAARAAYTARVKAFGAD